MDIQSKLKKLRRMSLAEVRSRLQDKWTERSERRKWRQGQRSHSQVSFESVLAASKKLLAATQLERPCAVSTETQVVASLHEVKCQGLLKGFYSPLGAKEIKVQDWNWHQDCTTGYQWDRKFYADLRLYNLPSNADIKYVWELSRHQYIFDLAANWWFRNCPSSGRLATELLLSWIAANRLYEGVNWTSGLEVATRAISWIWSIALIGQEAFWNESQRQQVAEALRDHAIYLNSHLSYFSSPFNHLIGEATGLLLLSEVLWQHPESHRWREKAIAGLQDYVTNQFYDDGYSSEQACSYLYYTLGFLMLSIVSARRFGRELHGVESLTHRGLTTGLKLRRPDGKWPPMGDLDSARAMPINPIEFWSFDSLSNLGAVLFHDEKLAIGEVAGPEVFWLTGSDGLQHWKQIRRDSASRDSDSTPTLEILPSSGYCIAKGDGDWLLFDAGPISAGLHADATPSTAHGHADTLQLLYFAQGKPILDDSGIPFYNGDPEWIRYFRSPAAHNTIEVEGVELVRFEGRLAWSCEVERPKLVAQLIDGTWLMHGMVSWPSVVIERCVLGVPGQAIWVADYIKTEKARTAQWSWQLPAAAALGSVLSTNEFYALDWDGVQLKRYDDRTTETSLTESSSLRPDGLRCHGYGQKQPGAVLRFRKTIHSQCLVLTTIGSPQENAVGVELHGLQYLPKGAPRRLLEIGDCRWTFF